jgi:acyl-CoA synthetase (AMP-forming)/AMP-acid ligase II
VPVRSPHPDVEIPAVSLGEFLFDGRSDDDADVAAFVDGVTGESLSFGELHARVLRVAAALAERGIGRGDVVALHAPNSPSWATVFHGVLRANAVVTSVNVLSTAHEIAAQLAGSQARLVVTTAALLDRSAAAAKEAGLGDDAVVVLDGADGHPSLADLLACTAEPPAVAVDPDDTAVLPYSSGTTGRAKGVILTHRNLVANLQQMRSVVTMPPGMRLLAVLPFFHIYGMTVLLNQGIDRRATVVTLPRFELERFLGAIAHHRAQRLYIVPPIAVALAKHPAVDEYDLSSVVRICSGAAPLDAELGRAVARRLGCEVVQGYGMTEMSPVSHHVPDGSDLDLASVGPLLPNMEAMIVDPVTGAELAAGGRGELWCRGPNVMAGYLNDPDATAATLDTDGWLRTGDLAAVDGDGVFTILDRLKELIKYKGYQVPPAELEALLLTHERIADAAVVGVRDAEGEEVPKAYVVARPGADLIAEEVIAFVAERVAPYKKVRAVEFLDAIPRSASGKILRKDLRAREAASTPPASTGSSSER